MKPITRIIILIFLNVFVGLTIISSQDNTTIFDSFDTSTEGWSIVGDGTDIEWRSNGTTAGGKICSADLSKGHLWYFQAPHQGDMSGWYGQILKFSLTQQLSLLEWIDDFDVIMNNHTTGQTLVYDNPIDPPRNGEVMDYSIVLSEASEWIDRHTGQYATKNEILSTLSSLTSLQIRGEYINGADFACLDNVEITAPHGITGTITIHEPWDGGHRQITFFVDPTPNGQSHMIDNVYDADGQLRITYEFTIKVIRLDGQTAHIGAVLDASTTGVLENHWLYIKVLDTGDTASDGDYIGWHWGDFNSVTPDLGESLVRRWVAQTGWDTDWWRVAQDGDIRVGWTSIPQCDGSLPPRLIAGQQGQVLVNPPNRLRTNPSTSSEILSEIPIKEPFSVISGPTCADDFAWWFVNHNGIEGWTAESNQDTYWIEPLADITDNIVSATAFNLAYGMIGSWNTDFDTMSFETTSKASYEDDNGRVIITEFEQNTLLGVWVEDHSQKRCETQVDGSYYWGNITLTPNQEFSLFTGVWGYCNDPQRSIWNSKYSDLEFEVMIHATYKGGNGRLSIANFNDRGLQGYWIAENSEQSCNNLFDGSSYWGQFILVPNQSITGFTGLWGYCNTEPSEIWHGQAIAP